MAQINNYELTNAIDKVNDAAIRVARHKNFHHEGENRNDLLIILSQLDNALASLKEIRQQAFGLTGSWEHEDTIAKALDI